MPTRRTTLRYTQRGTVKLYKRVDHPPRKNPQDPNGSEWTGGFSVEENGTKDVRYAIEWDMGALAHMVQKAYGNKSGSSHDGPITVTIHPADRRGASKEAADDLPARPAQATE